MQTRSIAEYHALDLITLLDLLSALTSRYTKMIVRDNSSTLEFTQYGEEISKLQEVIGIKKNSNALQNNHTNTTKDVFSN